MLMRLMDHWQLNTQQQAALLALNGSGQSTLTRYRRGMGGRQSRDQLERVNHLLGIHRQLRLLFPHNRDLAYRWMTTRNKAFDHLQPVEVIHRWGFSGLLMVRCYVDRACDAALFAGESPQELQGFKCRAAVR